MNKPNIDKKITSFKAKEPKKVDPHKFDEPISNVSKSLTLHSMAETGMIDQKLLQDFQKGRVNESEVKEKLMPFLTGSDVIAGILHKESGKVYSFAEALELRTS